MNLITSVNSYRCVVCADIWHGLKPLVCINNDQVFLRKMNFHYLTYLIGIHINYRLSISLYNVAVLNNSQLVVVLIGRLMYRVMSIAPWRLRCA